VRREAGLNVRSQEASGWIKKAKTKHQKRNTELQNPGINQKNELLCQ